MTGVGLLFLTAFGDADTEPPAAAGGRLMTMVELIAARGLWGGSCWEGREPCRVDAARE